MKKHVYYSVTGKPKPGLSNFVRQYIWQIWIAVILLFIIIVWFFLGDLLVLLWDISKPISKIMP